MAIERQPRLQPQRIPCSKADGFDLRLTAQQVGYPHCIFGSQRNLEAVLTGIAGAADRHLCTGNLKASEAHEGQRRERIFARYVPLKRDKSLRPLQGQQRPVLQMVERDFIGQVLTQVAQIIPLGRAVDHQIECVWPAAGHQIIQNAATFIQQQRIALLSQLERGKINRQHRLNRRVQPFAAPQQLPQMADIEQPGMFAGPEMFGDDAFILHRHPVSGEFGHPPAARAVPGIKRQRGGGNSLGIVFRGIVCIAH